jgi:hypothetical protein
MGDAKVFQRWQRNPWIPYSSSPQKRKPEATAEKFILEGYRLWVLAEPIV